MSFEAEERVDLRGIKVYNTQAPGRLNNSLRLFKSWNRTVRVVQFIFIHRVFPVNIAMSQTTSDRDEKPPMGVNQAKGNMDVIEYPDMKKRITIMIALYLALFLVNLDQNIISTAIPRITDEFDSISDIGWYGSAYLLTTCSFSLLMGRVYKLFRAKVVFLVACTLFEIGSAICGASPNSTAFIFGRAIAGLGSSGILSGIMVIMFYVIPLQQRPLYQGAFGAVFALASVIGPLIGGSLTDRVTWRWCFYINLPIGAASIIVTALILQLPKQKLDAEGEGWIAKLKKLDPIGSSAFLPGIVCLILVLQWGGIEYSWNNGRIIALLVLCAVFCSIFVAIQIWKKEDATVPPRIMKQRSIAAATWFGFWNGAGLMALTYYLPIWFQAVKGVSAVESGIMLLPLVLSTVITSLVSGALVSKIGYYAPFFLASSIAMPIGAGLLTTLTPSSGDGQWIGYQILLGIGLGFGSQQPFNVVQTELSKKDVPIGSSVIIFARFLGSAIFLPVAQTIFLNNMVSNVANLPEVSPSAVTDGGVTDLRNLVSGDDLDALLSDYNAAIIDVFYMVIATCILTMFGSIFVKWVNLKARAKEQTDTAKNKGSETVKVESA
ncbi:major facilitator superfamily domain-containing protein [Hypomontagnella monticulosa]|nr:major facilitator superfamily domain-containing protein [Hypomontagnella monticulosa]